MGSLTWYALLVIGKYMLKLSKEKEKEKPEREKKHDCGQITVLYCPLLGRPAILSLDLVKRVNTIGQMIILSRFAYWTGQENCRAVIIITLFKTQS